MKKYAVIISVFFVVWGASLLYAQMGGETMGSGRQGPIMGPPENGIAALSPDSKFVYAVFKDKLYQYTASDLKLKKSTYIGSSSEGRMPVIGGTIFFSNDSKRIYIMRGKTLLLFDSIELNYINKATFE
ncbi:MAG: hypothetical protein AB1480_00395 [Nitrospirota bacterium]